MRVIFMGTPAFAVGTLRALQEAGHQVVLTVTQPDKPKGRSKKLVPSPVKEEALIHGIPVFQPEKIRDPQAISTLRDYPADVIVVVAFGQILPEEVLQMTPYGCINVHASLLPRWRGAAPIQWSIMQGDAATGVTTMQMDAGLDTGDLLLQREVPIAPKETGGSLTEKLCDAGAKLLLQTLDALQAGEITPKPQGDSPTPYAGRITKETARIDWEADAGQIERLIRAMDPQPGASTRYQGQTMKLFDADVVEGEDDAAPGTIVKVTKEAFFVQTGSGMLQVNELQMPGKKRMACAAFLRGNSVKEGTILNFC